MEGSELSVYNNRIRNSVKLVDFVGITHTSIHSIKKH